MELLLLLGLLGAILSLGSCDPCDWNGATPDAYRDYTYECPPHRVIQADGHCDLRNSINCNGFCQVKTTFHYETEMPLGGTLARGPGWFGSSDWMRFGMFWKEPVNPVPEGVNRDVLNEGISGGLSRASRGLAEITHMDVLLDENECGYFTFLPMTKTVCGTYTSARGSLCSRVKTSKGNVCVQERSSWRGQNDFYKWAADDYGEPTVRGHMAFVRTDCVSGYRLPVEKQDNDRYALAMRNGGAMGDEDYEGWRKVWNNRYISDKMLGETYGLNDKEQECLSQFSESDARLQDALLSHCWYRVGQLMEEPNKLLPIQDLGHLYLDRTYYGGCSIYVKYNEDWQDDCQVSYAELAAAAIPSTFDCLKQQFKKGKDRWGVKGSHTIRPFGGSGQHCGAQVVVWGGNGHGINIGKLAVDWSLRKDISNLIRSVLESLPYDSFPPVEFGDCVDNDCDPFGLVVGNSTAFQ